MGFKVRIILVFGETKAASLICSAATNAQYLIIKIKFNYL